jgi:hypothetical protein
LQVNQERREQAHLGRLQFTSPKIHLPLKMTKPLDLVNHFFALTAPKGRNVKDLLGLIAEALTPDFKFTGPLMKTDGRDQYVGLLGQFLPAHVGYQFHKQFERGDDVCSIYDMTVRTPSGAKLTIAMVDCLTVRDGRLCEQKLFYDPRGFVEAFGLK